MKERQPSEQTIANGEFYGEDGVDLTLIRWMLAKTPLERLRTLESAVRSLEKLRGNNTASDPSSLELLGPVHAGDREQG